MSELILTCRTCGSEFTLPEGTPMRACPSCGTEHSRPHAFGSALDALRRAHQQRAACDFMNAAHSYQHVLIDHPNEHEALWGLVLCRYGVEYVTDERTGQRLPTMHFMQRRPITQDSDFALACQSAPEAVCAQYQRDADYILRIQQSVWAARTNCPVCDVFLCYKASDADSADGKARELGYARELYFHLIADGYRVFFAHESLQSLSGANYEAQIFHALQAAKVLLLVCSNPAHLTTPWVQSEWSRFLERADQDDSLRLIPLLYDGVAPESLPAPILTRRLEGLRMGELTSYNRLCKSMEAIIRQMPVQPIEPQPASAETPDPAAQGTPARRRPWRAALALVIVLAALASVWGVWSVTSPAADHSPDVSPTVVSTPEPAVEEPVVEEPAVEEPAVEEPVVEEPVVVEPAVEEPVVEEPVVEEPVIEEPAVEEPVVEEPAVEAPVVEEPAVEEPVIEEPAVEEPVIEEPAVEEPVVEEPVVEEPVVMAPASASVPAPTEKLEAIASENAAPTLIATQKIYKDTRRVDSYQRDEKSIINMPAGDDYLTIPFGVTTFRGNAFRMNAAVGYVKVPTAMETVWSVEGGKLEIKAGMRYGFGVYSQPAIIKWPREIRQLMALNEGYREKSALKEVIIAGQDGKVYFLDLTDGSATRAPINLGYPLRSTPSVHTLGYPVLTFGQYSNKLPNRTSKTMGLYYYSLADNKQLRLINTLDDRAYYVVGAMDTSALIDRNSNTLITIGSNGILYTEKMDLYLAVGTLDNAFTFKGVTDQAALVSYTKNQKSSQAAVESSLAMYGSYAFYADMGGILRCVDTTSMTTVWAVNTGDAVRASIALDLDETTNTLWLYTANTITNRSKDGDVTIRRFNAMTGEEDWTLPVNSIRKYKDQKDATGKDITAGAVASPIIGQHQLGELVYFTLSSVSAEGFASLTGDASAMQQPSVLIALDKATGKVVWTHAMDAYSYSSPVAVYTEAGDGWVIQCCSNGTIYLMDGLTGEMVSTLQVTGTIEGSPSVYDDMLVFGTTGKNTSYIYAIQIK